MAHFWPVQNIAITLAQREREREKGHGMILTTPGNYDGG
jgi:hypothetical protein